MIWRWIPASAPAARTARACRWASASRRCGWTALRLEERASDHRHRSGRPEDAWLAWPIAAARCDRAGGVHRQGRLRRAVLCAIGLDGADAFDRRRAAGVEISLWLQRSLAADSNYPARNRARVRRHAEARRCGGVPLAWRSLAGLGQARRRPAR